MKKFLKEALDPIVIGVIITVASTFITDFIENTFFNNRAIIIGLYLILLFVSLILLIISTSAFRKRQRRLYQQILIRYRNYIQLIGYIVLILSTAFFVHYNLEYNSSQTIPDLQIKLINTGSEEIHISDRGEFYLTKFRTPGSDQLVTSGRIKLKTSNNKYQKEYIIPSKEELIVYVQVVNPIDYLALFQRGDSDMQLLIFKTNGKMISIQGIPFDKETFSIYCIPYEIEKTREDSNISIL